MADRDRAILTEAKLGTIEAKISTLEEKINALEAKMDYKFDSQQRQLDDIKTLFYWGFGILISLYIFMMAYMIWDRRTAMQPALSQSAKAEDSSRNLIIILREYSKKHPELAELLRTHGML
ncbi:MAG: hemolysin XhlA family protein [Nanoarchaeota archaeon]|nr:hemolysin XhlA family protein [Nanoarchaeota archaeon]